MSFHSVFLQSPEEQAVRGWNGPLPFYMTHSNERPSEREEKALRDLEYLQQMYPAQVNRFRQRIAEMLDKTDYEGSMIYDEYPDRCSLRALAASMQRVFQKEEDNPPADEMLQVLLLEEIYKRRRGSNRRRYTTFF